MWVQYKWHLQGKVHIVRPPDRNRIPVHLGCPIDCWDSIQCDLSGTRGETETRNTNTVNALNATSTSTSNNTYICSKNQNYLWQTFDSARPPQSSYFCPQQHLVVVCNVNRATRLLDVRVSIPAPNIFCHQLSQ